MVASQQLTAGMTISVGSKIYRVDSAVKVAVPKAQPFIKTKLRDVKSGQVIEKNFKLDQEIEESALEEKKLEYLYSEDDGYIFLDIGTLEQVSIIPSIIGNKVNFLKEGVEVRASLYGKNIFTIQLPQFLELRIESIETDTDDARESKVAVLETGAKVEVPPFIEVGDIIKVDTDAEEYIQRV